MRNLLIVLDGLSGGPEGESILRSAPTSFARWASEGQVSLMPGSGRSVTPELALLGLNPASYPIPQGPLTVAGLGHEPPERSVHFHLSLASLDENHRVQVVDALADEDAAACLSEAQRLGTSAVHVLRGLAADNALVWTEGSVELGTTTLDEAKGRAYEACLPEGDGEHLLRRFIDDSVNLLSGLELNKQRVDDGLPVLNLLWPWGQGFRPNVPNLMVQRGSFVHFESRSIRVAGAAVLFGYTHGDRSVFERPLRPNFERLRALAQKHSNLVVVFDHISQARAHERWDDAVRMLDDVFTRLIDPVSMARPVKVCLAAPVEDGDGLSLLWDSEVKTAGELPFDERSLDDRRTPRSSLWESVRPLLGA